MPFGYSHFLTPVGTRQTSLVRHTRTFWSKQMKNVSRSLLAIFIMPSLLVAFTAQAQGADFSPRFLNQKPVNLNLIPQNVKPTQKPRLLGKLYEQLRAAPSPYHAASIMKAIENLWMISGNETVDLLMHNVAVAIDEKAYRDARRLLGKITRMSPDYAEAWYQRAELAFRQNDNARGMFALQKVLQIDPHHFRALQTLARNLLNKGRKKSALKAYRALLDICPHLTSAQNAVRTLSIELEGQET